jgi:hypothetical protein
VVGPIQREVPRYSSLAVLDQLLGCGGLHEIFGFTPK